MSMDEPNGIGRAADIASYQRPPESAKPKAIAACFYLTMVENTPNTPGMSRHVNLVSKSQPSNALPCKVATALLTETHTCAVSRSGNDGMVESRTVLDAIIAIGGFLYGA